MKKKILLSTFILFFVGYISEVFANNLDSSCAPVRTVGSDTTNYTTSFEVTNNCGKCVDMYGHTFKDGNPIGMGGWYCSVQPGEAKQGYYSYNPNQYGTGTFQFRITQVRTCESKCP
jgi:hypothetical protein